MWAAASAPARAWAGARGGAKRDATCGMTVASRARQEGKGARRRRLQVPLLSTARFHTGARWERGRADKVLGREYGVALSSGRL